MRVSIIAHTCVSIIAHTLDRSPTIHTKTPCLYSKKFSSGGGGGGGAAAAAAGARGGVGGAGVVLGSCQRAHKALCQVGLV